MLSQIIRFTLPPALTISSLPFLKLRQSASRAGAVSQYYGYTSPTKGAELPRKRHEVCWVIQWPETCESDQRPSTMAELNSLANGDATTLLLPFDGAQLSNLKQALEAPICEFACIRLSDGAPLSDAALQNSMHKTYTDAFKLRGFVGGDWAYAVNTNESSGAPCSITTATGGGAREGAPRLGVYVLGWESIELHQDGMNTAEFAEEIDKLMPYYGPGSGAWYAMFRKHE